MSRLQRKFKKHFGQQRLFVAVRNRGYRLTQRISRAE
ncbi:DNA-binding winged helix-turn-helix (wHTH) protein [Pseudomonas psychrotolerans]|nr:DNA-binding winged helix-turn-helix (wHTH) protein [Pseudomonas psychrotolerans]